MFLAPGSAVLKTATDDRKLQEGNYKSLGARMAQLLRLLPKTKGSRA